jgi:hypothetical protein
MPSAIKMFKAIITVRMYNLFEHLISRHFVDIMYVFSINNSQQTTYISFVELTVDHSIMEMQ